jgi:hypothetical protein
LNNTIDDEKYNSYNYINLDKVRPHRFINIKNRNDENVVENTNYEDTKLADPKLNLVVHYPKLKDGKIKVEKFPEPPYEVIHYPIHTTSKSYKTPKFTPNSIKDTIKDLNKDRYKTSYTYTKQKASQERFDKESGNGFYKLDQEKVGIGEIAIEHPNFFTNMNSEFGWGSPSWPSSMSERSSSWSSPTSSERLWSSQTSSEQSWTSSERPPSSWPPTRSNYIEPETNVRRNFVVDDLEATETFSMRKTGNF